MVIPPQLKTVAVIKIGVVSNKFCLVLHGDSFSCIVNTFSLNSILLNLFLKYHDFSMQRLMNYAVVGSQASVKHCEVTALFGIFLDTDKHQIP